MQPFLKPKSSCNDNYCCNFIRYIYHTYTFNKEICNKTLVELLICNDFKKPSE